jgi:hypothetical protein
VRLPERGPSRSVVGLPESLLLLGGPQSVAGGVGAGRKVREEEEEKEKRTQEAELRERARVALPHVC